MKGMLRPSRYGFDTMQPGDSIEIHVPTGKDVKRMCSLASQYGTRNDRGYRCKTNRQTRIMTITRIR